VRGGGVGVGRGGGAAKLIGGEGDVE